MNCDLDTSVPDWIIDHPDSAAVFAELRIDTSCGGKSLRYLCQQNDLDPGTVLERLLNVIDITMLDNLAIRRLTLESPSSQGGANAG